jgi:chromosome segregation ATPase
MKLPVIPRLGLYAIAGVVALVLLFWLGSKCTSDQSDYDKERASWEAERDSLRFEIRAGALENASLILQIREDSAAAAPIIAEVDTLLLVVERERAAKNRALAKLARRQREIADTSEMSAIAAAAIKAAQDARQEADTLGRAATSLRSVVSQQLANIAALTGRLQETQARADSAIALANRAPVYEGDKLLGLIPLPSRQASFIVGVGVGVVTTALVLRK